MLTYTFFQEPQGGQEPGRAGYLMVETADAQGATLHRVDITVLSGSNGKYETRRALKTGIDGRTERAELTVTGREEPLGETGLVVPFAEFRVRADLEGYYTQIYKEVRVYADTDTVLKIALRTLPLGVKNASLPPFTEP